MKFSEYIIEWHENRKPLIRASTFESESEYTYRQIAPFFADTELEDLKPLDIQKYVNSKLTSGRLDGKPGGLSTVSVQKHLYIIKQSLNDAVLYGYLTVNPALPVRTPRRKTTQTRRCVFLEAEQAAKVVNALSNDHAIQTAVLVTLLYGLRRSEILGLRWSSIDFDQNRMTIEHTVVKSLTIQAVDDTKTPGSHATFELLPEARTSLLRQREETAGHHSDYVFSRANGSVMRPDCLTRSFQRALRRNDIPSMRFHDLRHSTASILFARGWSLEDVKNWLRHADIETTSNIYLHYQQSRKLLVGKDLSGIFNLI